PARASWRRSGAGRERALSRRAAPRRGASPAPGPRRTGAARERWRDVPNVMKSTDLISIHDLQRDEVLEILDLAVRIKRDPRDHHDALSQKTLAMIFEKPSLRTRVSFEAGMTQLGGHAI